MPRRTLAVLPALLALAGACAPAPAAGPAPEAAPAPAAAPAPSAALNPVGTYRLTVDVNGNPLPGMMTVTGTPGAYGGSLSVQGFPDMPIASVTAEGQLMTVVAQTPDGPATVRLTFNGNAFTGNWSLGGMGGGVSGERAS